MAQEAMKIVPEFYIGTFKDEQASETAGRPIHKEVEMCRFRWIGDNKRDLSKPAHEKSTFDRASNAWISAAERFPEHYAAFKRNMKFVGDGTPIDEAPFLSNTDKADLKAINIHTIEALAALDMAGQRKIGMEAAKLVAKAKAYIDNAKGSSDVTALAAQNAEMKEQLARMQEQMAQLMNSKAAPAPAPVPVVEDEGEPASANSIFNTFDDATLKAFIKEKTGAAPRGTPSHATLVSMAEEANASAKEAA